VSPPNFHCFGPFRYWKTEPSPLGNTTSWRVDFHAWRIGAMLTVHCHHRYIHSDRWVVQTNLYYDRKWESE
jgi:hypothetical protein